MISNPIPSISTDGRGPMATFPTFLRLTVVHFDTLAAPRLHHLARPRAHRSARLSLPPAKSPVLSPLVLLQESISGTVSIPKLGARNCIKNSRKAAMPSTPCLGFPLPRYAPASPLCHTRRRKTRLPKKGSPFPRVRQSGPCSLSPLQPASSEAGPACS
jgi:hypothetical protein